MKAKKNTVIKRNKASNKLWDAGKRISGRVENFTTQGDRDLDVQLAEFDILGTLAHVTMLHSVNLISDQELGHLKVELKKLYRQAKQGRIKIEKGVEDIHSQVEIILTSRLGATGKKVHLGRSRNDQILVDLKMYIRHQLGVLVKQVKRVFDLLLSLSEKYREVLLPGYTHLQVAMPSSFGLWFAAYAESLVDDMILLQAAYRIINKNPLGSAAGYGSPFPLDRMFTTRLLGFDDLNYNSVYAQMTRGKSERIVSQALASVAATMGKLCMDITLYVSQNFAFISFPEQLLTGSSIMPHKKNPDVFELVRARCNRIQALPFENTLISANLPSGYHRDMQIIKEHFLPSFAEMTTCLEIVYYMLQHIEVRKDILQDERYRYIFSVNAIQQELLKGMTFRDAHRTVSRKIKRGTFEAPVKVAYTHEGSIGNPANKKINKAMETVIRDFSFDRVDRALARLIGA
jgi:argininosuccinate lyase